MLTRLILVKKKADVSNTGQIGASDAAAFLKKSGLKEGVLHKVSRAFFPEFHQLVLLLLHERMNVQHLAKILRHTTDGKETYLIASNELN